MRVSKPKFFHKMAMVQQQLPQWARPELVPQKKTSDLKSEKKSPKVAWKEAEVNLMVQMMA